jgi:hypothetical protein
VGSNHGGIRVDVSGGAHRPGNRRGQCGDHPVSRDFYGIVKDLDDDIENQLWIQERQTVINQVTATALCKTIMAIQPWNKQ